MLQSFGKSLKPRHFLNACRSFSTTPFLQKIQFFEDADEALKDGATILMGGFGICGISENCIRSVVKAGAKDLNIVSITAGIDNVGVGALIHTNQVKRLITSYIGENRECSRYYLTGKIEVEFTPQGNLIERIRAGGAGIPAFYTSVGQGTLVQHGGAPIKFGPNGEVLMKSKEKEILKVNGKTYLLEEAIYGDFAFVKAWKADRLGNLIFRKSARNLNPAMAKAAKVAIVEVEEIVDVGEIDPDCVHLPHIFVDRVVKGKFFDKVIENRRIFTPKGTKKSKEELIREKIARRAVLELKDGMCVNLGAGIPILASNFVKPGKVTFQTENGILGVGPYPKPEEVDPDLTNAFKQTTTIVKGASFFGSDTTFDMIRGGHLDWTFLGGMQVSQHGDLANWMVPGKLVKGMGGAMDLVNAQPTKVLVAMEHTEKNGAPKIVESCTLPLTGSKVANMIVTDMAVFEVDHEKGLTLIEVAEDATLDKVKASTGCKFRVSDSLKKMGQAEELA